MGARPAIGELALTRALETAPREPAADAVEHIRAAVEDQRGRLDDDIALLYARAD